MSQNEIFIVVFAVLSQGIFLFVDAKKRGRLAWMWGLIGLIQAPLPILCYYFFVIKPDRKKRRL
ncbi:transcriptional regulator [Bacillus atrophaeus]|uniref:transcriptional regulator n=1 Tax=Bacillus atrophaeus TaxID=1452 RepID=UPI002282BEE4|nr:transcriptional regulator [Bacillus atrophaeus]MCY8947009.1 transcriptional regulator [Bacillus atrophaeus]